MLLTLVLAVPALLVGQSPDSASLPLKRLALYENGVGYFERRGAVREGQVAEIPLEAGQLDDALKSLVLMSSRGVASVEFAPPLASGAARAVAGLPEPEQQRSLVALVRALNGSEVQVTRAQGAPLKGRIVEIADEQRFDKDGHALPDPTLVVFGDAGLVKAALSSVESVRPLDPAVALAWSRAMGAVAVQPEQQRLRVRGAKGAGQVAVGYTTEAPVWRTTYRLVLGPAARAGAPGRLQGFALVHNDSDEAWEGVTVSLVSGRPTSFLYPLAGPRYGRRELVTPNDGLDAAPQLATREARELLRGSLEGVIGLGTAGTVGYCGGTGMGLAAVGAGAGGGGRGVAVGTSSVLLADGPTPLEPAAVSDAGDLFLYHVKEPVFLGARKSALLPIIDGPVGAERVSVLRPDGQVHSGVRLDNSSRLTLEGGTLAVFTDGEYAGETQVDRVKPGEVRVLTHGEDLDLLLGSVDRREEGPVRAARLSGVPGARVLEVTRVDRLVHALNVTSRAGVPRTVLVELPEERYRVVSGATEDVRSPGQPRFGRLQVKPKEERELELVEEGAVVERLTAEGLTSTRLKVLLGGSPANEAQALLASLLPEIEKSELAAAQAEQLGQRAKELEADLARLRESLAALGKGNATAAAAKLGERFIGLEDQLSRVREQEKSSRSVAQEIRRTLLAAR